MEHSMDIRDMVRFDGHRDPEKVPRTRNLCVAPGFACGLQFHYGNIIDPIKDQCSVASGDWRFFDFSSDNQNTGCPNYGYYMAVYLRNCTTCNEKADTYGLVEIFELVNAFSFDSFQSMVMKNNPMSFSSSYIHQYATINGQQIDFEIDPSTDSISQVIQVHGVDIEYEFERDYRSWPLAQSRRGSIDALSARGRWTFDVISMEQRLIYDMTNPLDPRRIESKRPSLVKQFLGQRQYPFEGSYFDDSGSVVDSDSIESLTFSYDWYGVSGFSMTWRGSKLQSMHGSINSTWNRRHVEHQFDLNEYIVEVGIGTSQPLFFGKRRVNRVRIVTSMNRVIIAGYGTTEQTVYKDSSLVSYSVIAFHGRSDNKGVYKLGVVSML
jgi:Jacalin-like lectin domain